MAKLILRTEDGAEQEFSLDSGSLTIGRSPECDITIDDGQSSRRHCSVVKLGSGFEVADLGSTNGTLVNSTLIKKRKLIHGDTIRIGAVEIVFDDPSSAGSVGEMMNCFLVYAKGDRKGQKIELANQRTTIGRKASNTIVIDDVVSSSYHCEIVRGLNGYAIRDLGSTNGTLVNGEMITEAQLSHGARVRVGNTRFVFQDPAMAEIDLELAGAEDDDDWAMMRELDLSAVRKRNPATLVYGVLFLGIIGALFFFATQKGDKKGSAGPESPASNLVEDFSFETRASRFAWTAEPAGTVTVSIDEKVKGQGKSSLSLKSNTDQAEVFYGSPVNARNARFKLSAKAGARGDARAQLGLMWVGLGQSRWSSVPLEGGMKDVSLTASAPPWASRVQLGVRMGGQGTVHLDDVVLLRTGSADGGKVSQNEFVITATDGRVLDISHAGAPVLVHGRVLGGGSVAVEKLDDEHTLVTINGGSGVEFEEVSGFLSRGGFRAFTPDAEQTFTAAFPSEGTLTLSGTRKILLGPSGRAFAVIAATDDGRVECEARVDGARRTLTLRGDKFRFKTNLRGEAAEAQDRMANALNLFQTGKWGQFRADAQQALAEFPFGNQALRKQLQEGLATVNEEYVALRNRIDAQLADYKEFRDLQSLDVVVSTHALLRKKFEIDPAGKDERSQHLAATAAEEAQLRKTALAKKQGALAEAYVAQAEFEERYSKALLASYVAWYLPDAPTAAKAREMLAEIERDHPEVLDVLRKLGLEKGK